MAACPLCRQRKAKRACPAKGASICPHCCGTKRLVEIDCPPDCVYLTGAHAPAWEGRETERNRDLRRVAPHIQSLAHERAQLFFLALAGVNALRARRRDLDDRLLAQAVEALRKTVETRARGILYEHPAGDVRAQGLVLDLRGLFEAKDAEGRVATPDDRDLLPVLTALESSVTETLRESAGPTAFLDTVARLAARLGTAPAAKTSPLIVEP